MFFRWDAFEDRQKGFGSQKKVGRMSIAQTGGGCMKNSNRLAIVMLLVLVSTPAVLQAAHPFLIVTEANYPELQSRAAAAPWSAMKSSACSDCLAIVFDTGTDYVTQTHQMDDIASTCALAYILDTNTANRSAYVNKFYTAAMTAWPGYLRPG